MNTKTEKEVEPIEIWDKLTPAQKRELERAWQHYHPQSNFQWVTADKRVMPILLRLGLVDVKRVCEDDNWPEWRISPKGFEVYLSTLKPERQEALKWMISTLNSE